MTETKAPTWAVVDLETTGLNSRSDRIVEIAVVHLDEDFNETGSWTTIVDPGRHPGRADIHGLTLQDVRGAPSFADVADDLLYQLSGQVLVAHNASFDMNFMREEIRRCGLKWEPGSYVCTKEMASAAGARNPLEEACEDLGVECHDHHHALADARTAAGLLAKLAPRFCPSDASGATAWPQPMFPGATKPREA